LMIACQQDTSDPLEVSVPITQGKLKIEVAQNGFYAIPLADVQALGADLSAWNHSSISLTFKEQAVPFLIQEDQLVFYGQASDNIYSETRPYILTIGEAGLAMPTASAAVAASNTAAPVNTLWRPINISENKVYVSNARTEDNNDTWYWHTIHVEQKFDIDLSLENVADDTAELTMWFWGASHDPNVENDHDFDLVINDQTVSTVSWDGQTHYMATVSIPARILTNGDNRITLDNSVPGATFVDIMQLDRLQLTYPVTPQAIDDQLEFVNTAGVVQLSGFSDQPLLADITNPSQPLLLTDWAYEAETATLAVNSQQHITAVGPEGFLKPQRLTGLRPTTLTATDNQADLIIVTTDALAPALAPLVQTRQEQGLSVTVAPIAEIYDNFGNGEATPDSIRQFLRFAHTSWQSPAPRYLLIVGDGTYDNKNYLGSRPANNIPAYIVPVTHSGETVSDTRLTDLDEDLHPDMAVGRWPVDTIAEVESVVERTLAYEQGTASDNALFTADGTSSEFTNLADYLIEQSNLSDGRSKKLYGSTFDEVAQSWNAGTWLVTYVGHGSLNLWGKDSVFNIEAISKLQKTDSAPPIVLQFTCLTGFYAHPTDRSISETMLTNPNGPVLLVAATSLTLSAHQQPFAVHLLNNLQNPEFSRMGDALQEAKLALDVSNPGLREISDTFGLIGDPSALIVRP
ncbi:MAG: hypothetical protein KDE51_25330, partial [Anaerolineales bacterium]|nr:hypothetical protein [Anaerolineales bacterium]